jgi:hypothetical protein
MILAIAGTSFVAANVCGLIAGVLAFTKRRGEYYVVIWSILAVVMGVLAGMTFPRVFPLGNAGWLTWLPATILGAIGLFCWFLANRSAAR